MFELTVDKSFLPLLEEIAKSDQELLKKRLEKIEKENEHEEMQQHD